MSTNLARKAKEVTHKQNGKGGEREREGDREGDGVREEEDRVWKDE